MKLETGGQCAKKKKDNLSCPTISQNGNREVEDCQKKNRSSGKRKKGGKLRGKAVACQSHRQRGSQKSRGVKLKRGRTDHRGRKSQEIGGIHSP